MAKSYPTPTTGYTDSGGLVELGVNNIASQWDYVAVPAPSQPWRILIEGDLPSGDSTPSMSVSVFNGTVPLFSASGTWQVQGQSSANADKHNWKLKLRNAVTGNKLSVKIGDWFPMSSVTLKAYGTDRTLVRDSLTTDIWRQMHSYPAGILAPQSAYSYWDGTDFGTHTSALFSTAGFPAEVWQNGAFLGLYVLRSSADNDDYLMDDSNPQHMLIQPQHALGMWGQLTSFASTGFVFQSPAISGYNDQDDISTSAPDIYNSAARIIMWASQCNGGKVNIRNTYQSYLDLRSTIDYVLLCELSGSFDSMENNFMLGSWDATPTSGVWHFWPYDEDETWGLVWGNSGTQSDAENVGWVTLSDGNPAQQDPGFFRVFHRAFLPEIRARWRELRDAGIISTQNINAAIKRQVDLIDPASMVQDIANWPLDIATGAPASMQAGGKWSVAYIMQYAATRIAWIDAQWGYNG